LTQASHCYYVSQKDGIEGHSLTVYCQDSLDKVYSGIVSTYEDSTDTTGTSQPCDIKDREYRWLLWEGL